MKLHDMIDTYRVCAANGIQWKRVNANTLEISDADYQKLIKCTGNKRYIENLRRAAGRFCGGAFTLS